MAVSFVTERDEERVVKIEQRISMYFILYLVLRGVSLSTIPETKLTEMMLPEEKVLDKLNIVSTAKRLANMVRALIFPPE